MGGCDMHADLKERIDWLIAVSGTEQENRAMEQVQFELAQLVK